MQIRHVYLIHVKSSLCSCAVTRVILDIVTYKAILIIVIERLHLIHWKISLSANMSIVWRHLDGPYHSETRYDAVCVCVRAKFSYRLVSLCMDGLCECRLIRNNIYWKIKIRIKSLVPHNL